MRAESGILLFLILATTAACGSQNPVRPARHDFIAAFESGPEATRVLLGESGKIPPTVFFVDEVYLYDAGGAAPVACHLRIARFKEDARWWQHALAYYSYDDLIKHRVGLDTTTFFDEGGKRRSSLDRHVIYHSTKTQDVAERLAEIWSSYGPELRQIPPARAHPSSCGAAINM